MRATAARCSRCRSASWRASADALAADAKRSGRRAGFIGLAGRPNAGKSTLVNAIVGAHVAIVSERPQTTRRAIRGVATDTEAGWQLVMTDLPGVQRPRDALTERMQRRVEREIADSDAVLFVVNGEEGVGPGDRFISKALLSANADTPVVCVVNKVDRINNAEMAAVLSAAAELDGVDEIFPISARTGEGLEPLVAAPGRARPRRAVPLPARAALRPSQRGPARRADPRAGPAPHARGAAARGRGRDRRGRRARRRPDRGPSPRLGRDRLPEGHPDRQRRHQDQGDRHRRPQRAGARARSQGLPRPAGPGAQGLAPGRRPARPHRDRVIRRCCRLGWSAAPGQPKRRFVQSPHGR